MPDGLAVAVQATTGSGNAATVGIVSPTFFDFSVYCAVIFSLPRVNRDEP